MTPEVFAFAAFAALAFFLAGVAVGSALSDRQTEKVERREQAVAVYVDGALVGKAMVRAADRVAADARGRQR